MNVQKQGGFSALIIVLLIALVGVIGFVGWRMYDTNQQLAQQQAAQNNGQTPSTSTYLDIKELGARITLNEKTKDVSYAPDTPTDGTVSSVAIIDASIKALEEPRCNAANIGFIGQIIKTKDETYSGRQLIVDNKNVFKINEHYYIYMTPQAGCVADNEIGKKRGEAVSAFLEVVKTIKAL